MKTTKMMVAVFVALWLLAIQSVSHADIISDWNVNSVESWTSTSGDGDGLRTVTWQFIMGLSSPGTLNQTGGTITIDGPHYTATIIGCNADTPGIYNMSGTAALTVVSGPEKNTNVLVGLSAAGTWSLTGSATANVGDVLFDWESPGLTDSKVFLSGSASLTATALLYFNTANDYISFASGSLATLTVSGMVKADYQAWVTAGDILVDEAPVSNFDSTFKVTGNTLSLVQESSPVAEPACLALVGMALLAVRRRRTSNSER